LSNRKKKEVLRKKQEKKQKITSVIKVIAAIVIIALIAVGIYIVNKPPEPVPTAPPVAGSIVDRPVEDINGVKISTGEIDYSLRPSEFFGFIVEGYESKLLDHASVMGVVLNSVNTISYTEKIEDVKALSEYGLENTNKSVQVSYSDGTEFKLLMGDKCGDFEYYVMQEKGDVVYKMLATDYELLMTHPKEYRYKDICEVDGQSLLALSVVKNGEKEVEVIKDVEYTPTNEYQTVSFLVTYPYENLTASLGALQYILEEVSDLDALDIVDENATDLGKYGLTEDKATVLTITDATQTVEIKLGDKKGEDSYAICGDPEVVYLIPGYLYDLLEEKTAIDYVEDFIGIHNIQDVSSVDIVKGKEKHTMKMSTDSQGVTSFSIDGKGVEDKAFRKIYQYVIGLTFEDMVDKEPGGKVYMTVTYNFKDSQSVTYTYYDYDKKYCIVKASNGRNCITLKEELDTAFETVAERKAKDGDI